MHGTPVAGVHLDGAPFPGCALGGVTMAVVPGLAFLLSLAALGACGCASKTSCDLDSYASKDAGVGAESCGHVALGADASVANACAVAAFQQGHAFFAVYDEQGTDSQVSSSISYPGSGAITFLTWDGDPSGGGGSNPTISGSTCNAPSVHSKTNPSAGGSPTLFDCGSSSELGTVCR